MKFTGYWHRGNKKSYQESESNTERCMEEDSEKSSGRLSTDIREALMQIHQPLYIVEQNGELAGASGGVASIFQQCNSSESNQDFSDLNGDFSDLNGKEESFRIRAYAPALPLDHLGDPQFKARHNLRYPYIAGAMASGITSVEMVEAMALNGMMAFFGSGGLSISEVEAAIVNIKERLVSHRQNRTNTSSNTTYCSTPAPSSPAWGFNFIHSHGDPELEMALARLYLKHGVHRVSAAAFMRITIALVYYRIKGIIRDMEGNIITPNQIIAKVSRIEVARHFFSPPPAKLVAELLNQGLISEEEAELSQHIPMAQDLTAEADSGGHTDNRPAIALWPTMMALKDQFNERYHYQEPLCVGFAGGIATPESTAAAFQMGAAYVLTGSINHSCVEAGTSDGVKLLLAQAEQADVAMAPSADMFEIGARVQVLKRGTMFPVRAEKLYQIYKNYERFEDLPEKLKQEIEQRYLQADFNQKWEETRAFFQTRNIKEVERAEADPRHKMALVFRSYLGLSSRWSITGDPQRIMDYQIWCGPAIGAFNQWVKGTFLEKSENRKVAEIALNLLFGASICSRAGWLRSQGVALPNGAGSFRPLEICKLMELI